MDLSGGSPFTVLKAARKRAPATAKSGKAKTTRIETQQEQSPVEMIMLYKGPHVFARFVSFSPSTTDFVSFLLNGVLFVFLFFSLVESLLSSVVLVP